MAVAKVERETRDAIAITFDVPEKLREQFRFEPGQHLTLRTMIGGEDVRRSYSICAPAGGPLRIDPAPCWNRAGDRIVVTALAADKTRQMFLIER